MSDEYIPCEMAARGVTMNKAEILYPTPNNPKRLSEVKAKRSKYVEEHWREVHPKVVAELHRWDNRQKYNLIEKRTIEYLSGLRDRFIPRINHWEEHLE